MTHLCLGPGFSSACNTPFRRHKTWVHEGGIATPLIVHWPRGLRARGEFRYTPGHVCDLAPTLLELAGGRWQDAPGAPPLSGRSLAPVLAADAPVARETLWWLHEGHRALRVGDWKLVAAAGQPWELYDLARDRSEMTNHAAARPDLVDCLARAWTNQWETIQARARQDLPGSSGP
jgi:arylsulfatase